MKLTELKINGFKSISPEGQTITFGDINILIGANASGKSNLLSFFSMLNYMTTQSLQLFVGEKGGANTLLYFGAKHTPRLSAELIFKEDYKEDNYSFALSHAAGDTLIFTEESIDWKLSNESTYKNISLGAGHKETNLVEESLRGGTASKIVLNLLRNCRFFHFHDTSSSSNIRNISHIDDNHYLRHDAGNIASFLYALKNAKRFYSHYIRIVEHIQQIFTQFSDFVITPSPHNPNGILLNWRGKDSEYFLGPHQISDGSLRFIALTTLLLQPKELIPNVIVLDEPELGLHPYAISVLASMIRIAAINTQVIVATQSPRLVDEFETKHIIVSDWNESKQCSEFSRLDQDYLSDWLEDYCLSQLWEKNVLGGKP